MVPLPILVQVALPRTRGGPHGTAADTGVEARAREPVGPQLQDEPGGYFPD